MFQFPTASLICFVPVFVCLSATILTAPSLQKWQQSHWNCSTVWMCYINSLLYITISTVSIIPTETAANINHPILDQPLEGDQNWKEKTWELPDLNRSTEHQMTNSGRDSKPKQQQHQQRRWKQKDVHLDWHCYTKRRQKSFSSVKITIPYWYTVT